MTSTLPFAARSLVSATLPEPLLLAVQCRLVPFGIVWPLMFLIECLREATSDEPLPEHASGIVRREIRTCDCAVGVSAGARPGCACSADAAPETRMPAPARKANARADESLIMTLVLLGPAGGGSVAA